MSVNQSGTDAVDERSCRPSGARGFIGSLTRGSRPGLNAAAPSGLRCAEGLVYVSDGRSLAMDVWHSRWRSHVGLRNQILGMVANVRGLAAQQCHAGDANAVSTVCNAGMAVALVERPEMAERAPLMAMPLGG